MVQKNCKTKEKEKKIVKKSTSNMWQKTTRMKKKKPPLMFYIRACNPHACDYKWMKNLHPKFYFLKIKCEQYNPVHAIVTKSKTCVENIKG